MKLGSTKALVLEAFKALAKGGPSEGRPEAPSALSVTLKQIPVGK
jgi:hypothetical protein